MTSQKVKVVEVNPHIICVLCGGYLIDATTITECLHTFCRACIVRFVEASHYCPMCDTQVHETNPLLSLKPDYILQDLVFKLVPGLITKEVARRKQFYYDHCPPEDTTSADLLERSIHRQLTHGELFYTEAENISICLEYSDNGQPNDHNTRDMNNNSPQDHQTRYLLCPAAFTIRLLKKFVRNKFDLPSFYKIDIFHTKDALKEEYSLMDVAYIYTWRKMEPLRLFYSVYETKPRVSVPVHIPLPVGLARRHHLMTSSKQHRFKQCSLSQHDKNTIAEDNKDDIAEQIRAFVSRRSRVFKVPGSDACINKPRSRRNVSFVNDVSIKQEVMSDGGTSSTSSSASILPSPKRPRYRRCRASPQLSRTSKTSSSRLSPKHSRMTQSKITRSRTKCVGVARPGATRAVTGRSGLPQSSRAGSVRPTGGLRMTIPRYMIRGYSLTARRRKYDSSSSEPSTSSGSVLQSDRNSSCGGISSSSASAYDLYNFDEEEEDRPLAPKIVRRRLSDSSWSSDL